MAFMSSYGVIITSPSTSPDSASANGIAVCGIGAVGAGEGGFSGAGVCRFTVPFFSTYRLFRISASFFASPFST